MTEELGYGIAPFWFWNGAMEEEEIKYQIKEMADKGIRGFFIHPRQGMELPYLSEEYFKRVKVAVDAAKIYGLEVWLYDEYPYPSGISGGEVILDHPEYRCKTVKKVIADAKEGEQVDLNAPWGKVLSARAYPLNNGICDFSEYIDVTKYIGTGYAEEIFQYSGLTAYNKKRYFTGEPVKKLMWTPEKGNYRIYIFIEAIMENFKYFKNFMDPLNKDAVHYFLETTHERYKRYMGDEFGKTIKGVFTDEVTAFPPGQPWSELLPKQIKELHGIDIIDYLPALWEDMGEMTAKVRYAYWNTATETFIDSYDKTVYDWCEKNGLMYVGEKPILRSKQLEYMHVPGIDTGHQKVGSKAAVVGSNYRANGKMISSAAHFYQKPAALCEAFHSIGWGMTMQDMKWTLDWLALQGVDWYVIHAYYYTADALKKHDAPPSAFYQMPWWKDMKVLSDYAVKLGEFLHEIKRSVPILMLDPVTSTWTATKDDKRQMLKEFASIQNRMLEEQLDYYITDPQLFAKMEVLKTKEGTVLSINGEEYSVLVLPPMTNLEDLAVQKLREYVNAGGKVCAAYRLPEENIEQCDVLAAMNELFGNNGEVTTNTSAYLAKDIKELLSWLKNQINLEFNILPIDEFGFEELGSIQGKNHQGDKLMVMNLSKNKRRLKVSCKEGSEYILHLEPYESRWIDQNYNEEEKEVYELNIEGPMEIRPTSKNALRLSLWEATYPDGQTVIVDSVPQIDQWEESKVLMPIKAKKHFGCPKELAFTGVPVTLRNHFNIKTKLSLETPYYLIMEPGTLLGEWSIKVNEHVILEKDFVVTPMYARSNLGVDITPYVIQGLNQIEISIYSDVSFGGIRNPLYIFGDFSVMKEDRVWNLIPPITIGSMKDLETTGLPFYAGDICYKTIVKDMVCTGDKVYLRINDLWLEDTVEVEVNGYQVGILAWRPYEFIVPKEYIKETENEITIGLSTTAAGLFEGEYFNREAHCYETYEPKQVKPF